MGPYILVPHSLSGLEAIRWKQKYPDEVKAIIGLDMATPKTYLAWSNEEIDRRISIIKKMKKAKDKGLLFWLPLNKRGLNKEEIKEQKILWKKNAFNECYIKEAEAVLKNAEKVAAAGKLLLHGPESYEKHTAAQRILIIGNYTGHLGEGGHSGGVGVGAWIYTLLRDSVYVYGVITQMVKVRSNHDIFFAQVGVGPLNDSHDVAGGDGVSGGGYYCEGVS